MGWADFFVCACVCTSVTNICMCVYVYARSLSIYAHAFMFMCICVCLCMWVCVYVCGHVCACAHACRYGRMYCACVHDTVFKTTCACIVHLRYPSCETSHACKIPLAYKTMSAHMFRAYLYIRTYPHINIHAYIHILIHTCKTYIPMYTHIHI